MFNTNQGAYPKQSPKVDAMKLFIQRHQSELKSPAIQRTTQSYGNDMRSLNSLVEQLNQVTANWNKQAPIDLIGSFPR